MDKERNYTPSDPDVKALAQALTAGLSMEFIPEDFPLGAVEDAFGQVDRVERAAALATQAYQAEHPYER